MKDYRAEITNEPRMEYCDKFCGKIDSSCNCMGFTKYCLNQLIEARQQLQAKDKVIESANSLILKINKYAEISDDRFAGYSDTIYIETEKWINKYKEAMK